VHTTILDQSGGRSSGLYTRHRTSKPPEVALLEGVRCTTLPRTVADVARAGSRATALAMVDSILRDGRADRAELLAADAALGVGRGSRQSRALLLLGSGQAANGGESLVRLLLHDAGFEAPSLQFRIDDSGGLVGYADFAWPERGVVLEFDGRRKYTEQRFLEGRTSDEVLWQEKRREDRIRALGWMVVRVVWEDLQGSSPRLLRLIAEAGIPRRRQIGFEGAR
jgi:very-short-patch-repair endonuclease